MASPDRPSFFGRDDNRFGTLFREVQKTFEHFTRRTPFARFTSDMLSPKIDVAESKDAIEVTAELPGVDEKDVDVTLRPSAVRKRQSVTSRTRIKTGMWWNAAMARSAVRSPCRSIPTRRRSRPSSTMACCASTCRNRWR